jgi:cell division protein FtsQ
MFRVRRKPRARTAGPEPRPAVAAEARKRNRVILKSVLAGGIAVNGVLGLLMLYIVFLHLPYFNLQQVGVNGNRRLSREEVIEASQLEGGINLVTVSLSDVAERLKRHPWIRSATVYRRFPGRINVEIEERTPRAILAAGKLYYVDEQAEFFTRLFPGDQVNYPLFAGVTSEDVGSNASEVREMIRLGLALMDTLDRSGLGLDRAEIAEIQIDLNEGLSILTSSGRTLVLGKENFDRKLKRYGRLKRFLTRRGEWNNARFIDLDYEDRALVRPGRARGQG